ncbi:amino acid adenylation domain-containing protein [Streptomyces sp. JJ36]|uniref:non-ribosomal peptide synthetase n=1 Tax=Streptomyces sp. JJ36 TaxID=2736645 RepID=UPI001F2F5D8C|nr:amino acid adenylation domain-containing protein [Streptomyces sp. JJ36]MCF6526566.1 amino acid adenylation domain-containing protein [Streptomyces sp. JJ36]
MTSRSERPARQEAGLSDAKRALLDHWLGGPPAPSATRQPEAAPERGASGHAAQQPAASGAGTTGTPATATGSRTAPLSFAQARLWFLEQVSPGNPAYNLPLGLRLTGELDVPALEQALDALVQRHEALRTVVAPDPEGTAVQRVLDHEVFRLRRDDLRPVARRRRAPVLDRLCRAEARLPFDLSAGPLFRARLFRTGRSAHLLMLTLHHMIADAWSGGVLMRELNHLYQAFRDGRADPLPPVTAQFPDHAARGRDTAVDGATEELLGYWRRRLSGAPMELGLPTDHPRPASQDFGGDEVRFTLQAPAVERLQRLAADCGATPFAVILAALHTVLLRWTGQEDQLVGVPVAARTRPELQGMVGYVANTLALRNDLAGDPSFRTLVERVRDGANEAYAHQDLPFERLVEELSPDRDLSGHPVFQVLCTWQTGGLTHFEMAGLELEPVSVHTGTAKFDLQLGMLQRGREIDGRLEFATALFERPTVERFASHLRNVIDGAADDPARPLSQLPLLGAEERRLLLRWSGTGDGLAASPVPDQIARQAAETPEATAVVSGDSRLTYAELERRAATAAEGLRAAGVGPETPVGVCLPRSAELVVALLAVLMAGGAYVPLDPGFPDERLEYLLADTGADCVLTTRALAGRFAAHGGTRVVRCTDGRPPDRVPGETTGAARSGPAVSAPARPDTLAYIIHTSGSTGRPKGVQVTHRSMADVLGHTARMFAFGRGDTLCAVGAVCFDITVPEIFLPLITGGRLVLAGEHEVRDGEALRTLLRGEAATVLMATPATWRMLLAAGWDGEDGLRLAVSAGEALSSELDAELRARVADVRNLYGPTETTVWAVGHRTGPGRPPVPIGRPVGSARAYVVDARLSLVPPGVPGELLLGGEGVTRGYRGRPAWTAERFVPDPFGPPGGRLYRTGDLVRWRADGALEYLGRSDDQVKIRGYRIEPGEIEASLRTRPDVAEAVVTVQEGAAGPELHAHVVVPDGTAEPAAGDLRRTLAARLPSYMCPAGFTVLDAMPLNDNGKIDRRALATAAGRKPAADAASYRAPVSATAQAVAEAWRTVLGLERVGLHDNFFDLGGHSLLVLRVQRELDQRLGVRLPVVELFQYPTVAALAAHLEAAGTAPPGRDEQVQQARRRAQGRRTGAGRLRERRTKGSRNAGPGTGDEK